MSEDNIKWCLRKLRGLVDSANLRHITEYPKRMNLAKTELSALKARIKELESKDSGEVKECDTCGHRKGKEYEVCFNWPDCKLAYNKWIPIKKA